MEFGDYNKTHFFFLGGSGGSKAARIASSNTFFKPFCKTEGKTYLIPNAICCVSFILCNTYRCNDIHMSLSIFIKKIFNICDSIEYSMH